MDVRLPDGTLITNVPEGTSKADLTAKLIAKGYDPDMLGVKAAPVSRPTVGDTLLAQKQPESQMTQALKAASPTLATLGTAGGIVPGLVKGVKEMTLDPLQNLSAKALHGLGLISDEQLKQYSAEQQAARQQFEETYQPSKVAEFVGTMAAPVPGGKIAGGTALARAGKSMLQGAELAGAAAAGAGDVSSEDYLSNVLGSTALGAAAAPVLGGTTSLVGKAGKGALRFVRNRYLHPAEEYLYRLAERNPQIGYQTVADIRAGEVPESAVYAHAQETLPEHYFPTEFVNALREKSQRFIGMLSNIGAKVPIAELEARREARTAPLWEKFDRTRFKGDDKLQSIIRRYKETISTSDPERIAVISETQPVTGVYTPAGMQPTGLVGPSGRPIMRKAEAEYPNYLGSYLSDIRKDMASRIKGEVSNQEISTNLGTKVMGLREELTDWMLKNSKDYQVALNSWRRYSKLIDQKKVAEHLQGVLSNAVESGQKVSGSAFMRALDDVSNTITRATGTPRYKTLGELFNKSEMDDVNQIAKSIAHQAHLEQRAVSGAAAKAHMAVEQNVSANVLSRPVTIIEGVLNAAGKQIRDDVKKRIAGAMLRDPQAAADMLETAIGKNLALEQRQKFIANAVNATRQAIKKPMFMGVFGGDQNQKQQDNRKNLDVLKARYGMQDYTQPLPQEKEVPLPPDDTLEDMGRRYETTE